MRVGRDGGAEAASIADDARMQGGPMRAAAMVKAVVVVAAVVLAAVRFVVIDASSHSASDTLRPWVIEVAVIAGAAALIWLAVDRLDGSRPDESRR
jgi:threonine/homoserine/homoserine lactone efflux protein